MALDSITVAPASCPKLCANAPQTQKIYPLTGQGRCSRIQKTTSDIPPPQAERMPAVAPRVKKAKRAFIITKAQAVRVCRNSSAYMTTILERPSFNAGISPKSGVMQDSSHESAIAREKSIPVSAISLTLAFRNVLLPFACFSLCECTSNLLHLSRP